MYIKPCRIEQVSYQKSIFKNGIKACEQHSHFQGCTNFCTLKLSAKFVTFFVYSPLPPLAHVFIYKYISVQFFPPDRLVLILVTSLEHTPFHSSCYSTHQCTHSIPDAFLSLIKSGVGWRNGTIIFRLIETFLFSNLTYLNKHFGRGQARSPAVITTLLSRRRSQTHRTKAPFSFTALDGAARALGRLTT